MRNVILFSYGFFFFTISKDSFVLAKNMRLHFERRSPDTSYMVVTSIYPYDSEIILNSYCEPRTEGKGCITTIFT
jgi:hypothetical protein